MYSNYKTVLEGISTADLEHELHRRREEEAARPPVAAGRCKRCGAEWFFVGPFSAPRFERQADAFMKDHVDCQLSIDGGGI